MPAEDETRHVATFRVAHDHPALPGHFPGNPIVPGVVILDAVIGAAERWVGGPLHITGLPNTKFLSPLRPGVDARVELERRGSSVAFTVVAGGTIVAKGSLSTAGAARA
jgi:3-hydroxymyristoyl/3-hydroxydecanoyl-(acyl carrier protein) dehydratase